jgi:hypothetical protein
MSQETKPGPSPVGTKSAVEARAERLQVATAFAAAIMTRGQGRKPDALAREVIQFTDAFMAEFDRPRGN